MKFMPKVSVIVPVYNAEKYIKKCLESIINQTMKDLEIIVVDDGSTDNSAEIIDETIKSNDSTIIKYYKKENGGLSDARNYGAKYAEGKYISFIDSDDFIDEDLYENLERYMDEEIELIKFKMKTVNENGNLIEKISGPIFKQCIGEEAFNILSKEEKFLEVACIYLYNREFWNQNNFKYAVRIIS